jgi:hypothetical protein
VLGVDAPGRGGRAQVGVERPRVGALGASCTGEWPFSFMQPVLSPIAVISTTSSGVRATSRGTARPARRAWTRRYATAAVLGEPSKPDAAINRSKSLWTVTFEQPGFQTEWRSVTAPQGSTGCIRRRARAGLVKY